MQFELRTQVIEPQRKTFQHLIDRYGDRPASRYEEGSIGIQAMANYHYRPLWDPSKEIYSPDFSALKLTDPYSYVDPRQFYYAPYVTSRAAIHESFGSTLDYIEKRGLFRRLPQAWADLFQNLVLPLRHYEAAGQMIGSSAARYGWGTTVTQACAFSAFDRIGNAQILSRVGISIGDGSADPLDLAKTIWIEDEALQPLRKHVEEMLVEKDWGKAMVALDVTDQLLYGLLFVHLDEAALGAGAGSYSLVVQHQADWFADQRKWFDGLYKAWVADPEHGADNTAALAETVRATLDTAIPAVRQIALHADRIVGDGAGSVQALTALGDEIRARYAGFGVAALTEREAS